MSSPTTRGVVIVTLGWILLGFLAWLVVATAVGMVIGRTIRLRDRQWPDGDAVDGAAPVPRIPRQNAGRHDRRGGPGPPV